MILVVGGTGNLGRRLTPLLVARSERVRVFAREPSRAPTVDDPLVEVMAGDVRDPAAVARAVEGATTVVCAATGFGGPEAGGARAVDGDGNANVIRAAKAAGVDHLVLMSIPGASQTSSIALFRAKAASETALRASGLAWTIVRSATYMETWLELIGRPLVVDGRTRVFGRGDNPNNFVSAEDVARVVEMAVTDPGWRGATVEVAGPDNLTFDQVVATVRIVTGVEGRVDHIPVPMMRTMATLLGPFKPVLADQMRAAIAMATTDQTMDPASVRAAYPQIPATPLIEVARGQFSAA